MRHFRFVLAGAALAALSLGASAVQANDPGASDDAFQQARTLELEYRLNPDLKRRVDVGFEISPVPLNLAGKSAVLVGLGSYIVNAQVGCSDCHTSPPYAPGGDPFMGQPKQVNAAGYLAGGQPFGPGIVSRNLTPEDGLPAGRTYAQFTHIMRTGVDLDNAHPQLGPLLQVMPWPSFQSMADRDLLAIYAFLSAIPPVSPAAGR